MKRRLYLFACMALAVAAGPLRAEVVVPPDESASAEEAKRYFTEDPDAPIIAPKGYDVTIVEYMDYQCPSCRTSHEPLQQLLAKDKKVRVIFKQFPILGPTSITGAQYAVAAQKQGKFVEFHDALMDDKDHVSQETLDKIAASLKLDTAKLKKDADSADFVRHCNALAAEAGWKPGNVDITVICESPKVGPHVAAMRAATAAMLGVDASAISIKATTSERLGFTGRGEGIAAQAVCLLVAEG